MEYTIAAHPTLYHGVQFRSRLEARWAAYFDLLGWKWEYEPLDLKGWVPDFSLNHLPVTDSHAEYYGVKFIRDPNPLVEVKPFNTDNQGDYTPGLFEAFSTDKIIRAHAGTVLLLGLSPEYAWRIPDAGGDGMACPLVLPKQHLWKKAGNLTQWRPR